MVDYCILEYLISLKIMAIINSKDYIYGQNYNFYLVDNQLTQNYRLEINLKSIIFVGSDLVYGLTCPILSLNLYL